MLQNELKKRLPQAFAVQFPAGTAIAYSVIPLIPSMEEPLKTQVQAAFADSLQVVWQVMVGIAGLGLVSSLAMKRLPLHTQVDEKWEITNGESSALSRQDKAHEAVSAVTLQDLSGIGRP